MKKNNRIIFLIGAGASIPAGMPSTSEITEHILTSDDVYRDLTGVYHFKDNSAPFPDTDRDRTRQVGAFINILAQEIKSHIGKRELNYEDIYYALEQTGNDDDPSCRPYIQLIKRLVATFLAQIIRDPDDLDMQFRDIVQESKYFIVDLVREQLNMNISPQSLIPLNLLKDACADPRIGLVDIFTLNHDRVIETLLEDSQIPFVDGFGPTGNNIRYWRPSVYDGLSKGIRLFKLHGGIDWYMHMGRGAKGPTDRLATGGSDIGRPHSYLLIGTINKIYSYSSGPFADLHCHFHHALHEAKNLIVCGYGFGDEGINWKFFEFCFESNDRKAVVISPDSEKIKERPQFSRCRAKNMAIPRRIENVTWKEVADFLGLNT